MGNQGYRIGGLDLLDEEDVQGRTQKTALYSDEDQYLTLPGQISLFVTEFYEPASFSLC